MNLRAIRWLAVPVLALTLAACGNADRSVADDPAAQEVLDSMPDSQQSDFAAALGDIPDGSFASVRFCDGLVNRDWTEASRQEMADYLNAGLDSLRNDGDPISMTRLLIEAVTQMRDSVDGGFAGYEQAAMAVATECTEVVSGGRGVG